MKPAALRRLVVLAACAAALFGSAPLGATAKSEAPAPQGRDAELLASARKAEVVSVGKEIYAGLCKACHGEENVQGESPSNLFDTKWFHGGKPTDIERIIALGLLEKGMPAWGEVLPAEDVAAVVAYLLSVQPAAPRAAE
jgi:cytochrome c oxidase cbb3-type subunit 3